MSNTQNIPAPPKPRPAPSIRSQPGRVRRHGETVVTNFTILGGFFAWMIAFAVWSQVDSETVDATRAYTGVIGLAIVGGTLLVVAAIFDSRR